MVIFSAAFAVTFAIFLVENEGDLDNVFPYVNLLLCGYLGVPLFIAVDIYADVKRYSIRIRSRWYVSVILVLMMVYFYLPGSEETLNITIPYIRYTILAIAAHLLVSFIPFLNRGTLNGFWHFNRVLFLRFLLSVLYSAAFFVGLSLAIFAVDNLFDAQIEEKIYAELFFFMAGVFNTWFFVAGFPRDYEQLDVEQNFPRGLRTFILYVLIPLLGLYFLILYSYSAKIIIEWNWPTGIMVYMIIIVAVIGTLTMLLAYPYDREDPGGPIRFLQKGFFWMLTPIIVMLYLAIGLRVAEYGVTINRYITIFLAVWLTGISFYMILRGKDIRFIPMSLFVIILICSFGPWGIFQVSERSQVARLETILEQAGLLVEDEIVNEPEWDQSDTLSLTLNPAFPNEDLLSDSLHNEVMSILGYLEQFHGLSAIEDWFEQDHRLIARTLGYSEDFVAMELMGLRHGYRSEESVPIEYPVFYAYQKEGHRLNVSGFDYLYQVNASIPDHLDQVIELISPDSPSSEKLILDHQLLTIRYPDESGMQFNLDSLYQKLKQDYMRSGRAAGRLEIKEPAIQVENDQLKGHLIIESLGASEKGIVTCSGKLLIRKKIH